MKNCLLLLFLWVSSNVLASVNADFTATKFSGCPPLLVTFLNTSQPSYNLSYSWNFDNGNTSTLANPSAAFNTPGEYNVTLVINNGTESDTVTKTITVYQLPQVDFHAVKTEVCANDTVLLINDVVPGNAPIIDYGWDFGNGIANSGANAFHRYSQQGAYNITLVVQDANGCSANTIKNSYIQVMPAPVAAFTASPLISCNDTQSVSFTNASTGTGLTYFWKLNTGVTSNLENPTHVYIKQKKTVTLVATNTYGCSDTATQQVSAQKIIPDFTSKTEGCTGEEIQFTNTSNVSGNSWWSFGDGTTSTNANPVKKYTTPGVYTVKLTVTVGPCSETVIKTQHITIRQGFVPSFMMDAPEADCSSNSPLTVNFTNTTSEGFTFYWNFGDGTSSTQENPSHTYNRNANFSGYVIITDTNGCSIKSTFTRQVRNFMPAPDFRADNTVSCPGGLVRFHNRSVGATSYKWYFGDGDSASTSSPSHYYRSSGFYTVTLIAYAGGCDSSITKTDYIEVKEIATNFAVDKTFSPCPPFVTMFTSSANRSGLKYKWDFGDGTTDTAANPTHVYFHPGIFTVKMITTTSNGCKDTVSYPDLIEVQGPMGTFDATPTEGCVPLSVNFGASISANTEKIWCDLGDGTLVVDSLQFTHVYTTANTFNPKFILVDEVGCTVPYDLPPIETHELPVLQLRDTFVCENSEIPVSLGSDNYKWEPAIYLSCDTCANTTIIPQETVSYKVTATTNFGCAVTDTMTVAVDMLPTLTAPSSMNVCRNSSVNLFTGDAAHISWSPALYLSDSTISNPTCIPLESVNYIVLAFNSLGCSTSTRVSVNVIEKIELNQTADTTICAFEDVQLSVTAAVAPNSEISYYWEPASFGIASDNSSPIITGIDRTSRFRVVASSETCIADTAFFTVRVIQLPTISVSESVTTTPMAEVPLLASSNEELNYEWSAADSLSCNDCRATNLYPSQSQTVYVTGTNSFGCKTTDSVQIDVAKCDPNSIFLPNIFTPNNDGLNDRFLVRSKTLANLDYLRIFDQWGGLIFETRNASEGWDGTIKGQPAPVAVYVCMLGGKCENGESVTKSSNITLIR